MHVCMSTSYIIVVQCMLVYLLLLRVVSSVVVHCECDFPSLFEIFWMIMYHFDTELQIVRSNTTVGVITNSSWFGCRTSTLTIYVWVP